MPNKGTGGAIYAGSGIDHATKYVTMTFLSKKSDWYDRYESIIRWLKNMTGKTHKIWRSDGAKEFEMSDKIKKIHDREGIQHSITPPYSPNKNPSERFWRTLIEAIAAILITAGMSTTWWVEVAKYVVYVYNRTPRKEFNGKTPYQKFFGRKHHEVKLHTWGCLMYVHVETRSKKDLIKARPAMFIGIDQSGRWLGVYLDNKELLVTDSASFVDNVFPFGKHKKLMGNYNIETILKHLEQEQLDIQNELKKQQQTDKDKKNFIERQNFSNSLKVPVMNMEQGTLNYGSQVPKKVKRGRKFKRGNTKFKPTLTIRSASQPNSLKTTGPVTREIEELLELMGDQPPIEGEERDPDSTEPERKTGQEDNGDLTDESVEEESTDDEQTSEEPEEQEEQEEEQESEKNVEDNPVHHENVGSPGPRPHEVVNEQLQQNFTSRPTATDYTKRRYEHDEREETHQQQKATRRYPSRARLNTGRDPKILEQLAQTPPKQRKPYIRAYRRDLEEFANSVMTNDPNLNKWFRKTPQTVEEAKQLAEWPHWKKAIETEIEAIKRTGSMEQVTNPPPGIKPIRCRWVFKIKPANEQEPERFKARLVAKGFTQKYGIDYQDTFAAVAKMTSLRILIALAAINNSRLTKLDVSNAFLESEIDRDVYIYPPEGFPPGTIFKLKKALYGLKQSPRLFAKTLEKILTKDLNFRQLDADHCIYQHDATKTRVLVVVDDCIIEGNNEAMRRKIEDTLKAKFTNIKVFDKVESFLNIQFDHTTTHIKMHQQRYVAALLKKFGLSGCKIAPTPAVPAPQGDDTPLPKNNNYRQIVGSLIYLMATRPDICSAVIELSKHLESPTHLHLQQSKRVLRYLAGTQGEGINFEKGGELSITTFSDSDWAGCRKTRKSVSGFVVYLGKTPISWKSKTQPTVALSSCEAEYVALSITVKEILWITQFFKEVGHDLELPIFIFGDNTAAIALAKDPVHHERTKHIDIKHHFLRQHVMENKVRLTYVNTADNVADLLTKATQPKIFHTLKPKMVYLSSTQHTTSSILSKGEN